MKCIEKSKLKLQKHQKTLVQFLNKNRGVIAAFDVGTGKTLTAVTASQCYLDNNKKGKIVVVTPVSLQENFKKELKTYGVKNLKPYHFYTIRKFATTFKGKALPSHTFLIIDEAHNLRTNSKSSKSETNAAATAIAAAKTADKVLLMTATPLYNSPKDVLNLVAMVKGEYPMSVSKFKKADPKLLCQYFKDTIMFFENPKSSDFPKVVEHDL